MPEDLLELLGHVIARQSVTTKPGAIGTKSGFGSRPPIDLGAMELRNELQRATGGRFLELEAEAWDLVERPARLPLGACPCGQQLFAEFDRVSAECPQCGEWSHVADSVAAAAEYCADTWLTPAEIERETRTWQQPVKASRVRTWKWRSWITPNAEGRYRLADVLDLIDHEAARAA